VNCSQAGDFGHLDYEGYNILNGVNERQRWITDPAGSGKTVAQLDVYGNDSADHYGGTRSTLYETNFGTNCNGCNFWFDYGIYIPAGFQYPDQWFLLMENFVGSGSPAQALELMGAGCVSAAPRNHVCWRVRQTGGETGTVTDLGLVQEGHWLYVTAYIEFRSTATGVVKVWHAYDQNPDVNGTPDLDRSGIYTLFSGTNDGRSHLFLYRGAASASQHQTVDYCGFHRDTTSASAQYLPNC
jgi:hypothetical protein